MKEFELIMNDLRRQEISVWVVVVEVDLLEIQPLMVVEQLLIAVEHFVWLGL